MRPDIGNERPDFTTFCRLVAGIICQSESMTRDSLVLLFTSPLSCLLPPPTTHTHTHTHTRKPCNYTPKIDILQRTNFPPNREFQSSSPIVSHPRHFFSLLPFLAFDPNQFGVREMYYGVWQWVENGKVGVGGDNEEFNLFVRTLFDLLSYVLR